MTAHAAQGQKQPAAIVDLQIGRGTNVASPRVPSREDLLIYRPFARDLYAQGGAEGPELLLKTLRGEQVGWRPSRSNILRPVSSVAAGSCTSRRTAALSKWNRKDGRHFCKQCVAHKTNAGVPFKCMEGCGLWKFAAAYSPEELRKTLHRVCIDCADQNIVKLVVGPSSRRNSLHPSGRWRSRVVVKAAATAAWGAARIARRAAAVENPIPVMRTRRLVIGNAATGSARRAVRRRRSGVSGSLHATRRPAATTKQAKARAEYASVRDWSHSDRKCKLRRRCF